MILIQFAIQTLLSFALLNPSSATTYSKTALGTHNFKDLLENSTVVIDKTQFIEEFLVRGYGQTLLITGPQKWAKSTLLTMLQLFLEIVVDDHGKRCADKYQTRNYQLFANTDFRLNDGQPFQVTQNQTLMNDFFGEYPVIYVSFKKVSWYNALHAARSVISSVFANHQHLIDGLSEADRAQFRNLLLDGGAKASATDVAESLRFLSRLLHERYSKKVFILVDDYMSFVTELSYPQRWCEATFNSTREFLGWFMVHTFKDNPSLERAMITGSARIMAEDLPSELNYLHCRTFDNVYARFYGFTQDDVNYLFQKHNIPKELAEKAEYWYNGYAIVENYQSKLYNPSTIISFVNEKKLNPHTRASGLVELLKYAEVRAELEYFLQGIRSALHRDDIVLTDRDYITFRQEITQKDQYHDHNMAFGAKQIFRKLMLATGYVSPSGAERSAILLTIPNFEVRYELLSQTRIFYLKKYSFDGGLIAEASGHLLKLLHHHHREIYVSELRKTLAKIIQHIPTSLLSTQQDEAFLHELLVTITVDLILGNNMHREATEIKFRSRYRNLWLHELRKGDLFISLPALHKGLIIDIRFNETAQKALEMIRERELTNDYEVNRTVILRNLYLGLNVGEDKSVECVHQVRKSVSLA